MTEHAIRAVGLTKKYRSGTTELVVLRQLDLEVPSGERLALIGESGAGKSTLLHLLGGLDHPTSGSVFHGERDIFQLSDRARSDLRNQDIGFVWQTQSLLPEFTALENVMMPLLIRGVSRSDAATPAAARLEEVGLKDRATHRAGELSGGEQQRVVLARALVSNPKVLLADEPTGNLDHNTGGRIIDLLADVHRGHSLTSVYVTHNLTFARTCDRILELGRGVVNPLAPRSALSGPATDKDLRNHV